MTFSDKLKELRTKKNYLQESLAELLNVSRQEDTYFKAAEWDWHFGALEAGLLDMA